MPAMSMESAIKCFSENIQSLGRPPSDPEKYNLYVGLAEMAEAIKRVEREIASIKKLVEHIEREVR